MKRTDVQVGGIYAAKVSGKVARVKIESEYPWYDRLWREHIGWEVRNVDTKRIVRLKTAARLRPIPATRREILDALTRAEAEEGIYDLEMDAAAPELLEALEDLTMGECGDFLRARFPATLEHAEIVLKKVRGQ